MDHFHTRDGELYCEDVPLATIAEAVGTPVYVYSRATLERHARVFSEALAELDDPWIAFALKSNPNLAVSLPGGISLIVNEQTSSPSGNTGSITVNALHVKGPSIDIIVGSAQSGITCS